MANQPRRDLWKRRQFHPTNTPRPAARTCLERQGSERSANRGGSGDRPSSGPGPRLRAHDSAGGIAATADRWFELDVLVIATDPAGLHPLHPRPRRPAQPADWPRPGTTRRTWSVPVREKASGCTDRAARRKVQRLQQRDECGRRPPCVRDFPAQPADSPQITSTAGHAKSSIERRLASSKPSLRKPARHPVWPTAGPQTVREPLAAACKSRCHHSVTPALTCGNYVAGDGFEPS
jgi:hypothetical protein